MKILAATTIRNEGPYLLEWIAWHRMIGVTDFLVCSNDCTDGSDLLLDRLASQNVVQHLQHSAPAGKSVQWSALKTCWNHPLRRGTDWMLVSDIDEFPMIYAGAGGLADLIAAVPPETSAIALAWRLFGAAGVDEYRDRPVVEQFIRSAPPVMMHPIAASFFKSLFRPEAFSGPGVHRPRHRKNETPLWVNGSGHRLPPSISGNDKRLSLLGAGDCRGLAEMNHYSLRSAQGFIVKSERGLPNRSHKRIDLSYWVERNFNTQPNDAAFRFSDRLNQHIDELKSLPGVAELHDAAVSWHQERFRKLIATQEGYDLYCQILLAPDSAVLPLRTQDRLLRLFTGVQQTSRQAGDGA